MSSKIQLPVFTETNLGTRIAIPVSPDITTSKFKGELERAHIDCFPELGFLSVNAVMVKQNSCLYHLPDLLPLKHVFQGSEDSWFLYVTASLLKTRKRRPKSKRLPECSCEKLEEESIEPIRRNSNLTEGNCQQDVRHLSKVSDSYITAESPRESLSGIMSVSGIINRYFTDLFDIDLIESTANSETPKMGQCDVERNSVSKRSSKKTRPRLWPSSLHDSFNSVAPMNRYERSEVGRRLVIASKNIESSQRLTLSKGKKLWNPDAAVIRNLVFEIDDNDKA